jgi:hypothetical protein
LFVMGFQGNLVRFDTLVLGSVGLNPQQLFEPLLDRAPLWRIAHNSTSLWGSRSSTIGSHLNPASCRLLLLTLKQLVAVNLQKLVEIFQLRWTVVLIDLGRLHVPTPQPAQTTKGNPDLPRAISPPATQELVQNPSNSALR